MAQEPRKSELIAELALARRSISANVAGLRRDLDFVTRTKRSIRRNQFAWLGGSGLVGYVIAKLPARTKTRKVLVDAQGKKAGAERTAVKAGLLVTLLKIAFDMARPVLTKWVTRRIADYAEQRFGHGARV
jgi:hypothetical protein